MGLQALIDKYDNGSFTRDGWFSLGSEEVGVKSFTQVDEEEKQIKILPTSQNGDTVFSKCGKK